MIIADGISATIAPDTTIDVKCAELNGAMLYTITFDGDLSELAVTVSCPASEAAGRWYPAANQYARGVMQTWNSTKETAFMYGAPIYSYYSQDDANLLCTAMYDSFTTYRICSGIDEPSQCIVVKFLPQLGQNSHAELRLYVDRTKRKWYESVQSATEWWYAGRQSPVPECAYDPVYSTWYAFQRDIDADSIIAQCRAAYKFGCRTLIIDDGWATPRGTISYNDSGDWKPNRERFPNFKGFVDEIHSIGMKALLWVAPGLSGYASASHRLYDGKFLSDSDKLMYSVLDPRYPDVRAALCQDVCRLVEVYGFDGVKIDFIDSIRGADCEPDAQRDIGSVSEALRELLQSIHTRLTSIRPDVMIEYRQNYCGPDVALNANIMRSADCAQDYLTNRMNTLDLRLYTKGAVHSDMIQFIYGDTPESTALQLVNVLFATPQISPRFERLSREQLDVIRFWLNFMSEKRELLQKSSFELSRCYANYPVVTVRNEHERLSALYAEQTLVLDEACERVYAVNAAGRAPIYLGSREPYQAAYRCIDCKGVETESGKILLDENPRAIPVPFCGMVVLEALGN